MGLPNTFAAATTIQAVWWDQNYNALGLLTPIQGALVGQNIVTLTPSVNNPGVAYSVNQPFFGINQSTNNGGVTISAGSSIGLLAYKDTTLGPVALTGGELAASNAALFFYDPALNGGSGGLHLINPAPPYTRMLSSLASIAFTAINPQSASLASVTLNGAKPTDNVMVAFTTVSTGITYSGYVSASNTVVILANNYSASTITPAGQFYRATVVGFT